MYYHFNNYLLIFFISLQFHSSDSINETLSVSKTFENIPILCTMDEFLEIEDLFQRLEF